MKAVKINMKDTSGAKPVKALIISVILGFLVILACTAAISLFLVLSGNLFRNASPFIMLFPLALSGYISGYVAAAINKSNGMLLGAVNGLIILIILLVTGFALSRTDISYMLIIKAIALILPSAIGGVKALNKKEKFKI